MFRGVHARIVDFASSLVAVAAAARAAAQAWVKELGAT